MEYQAFSPRGMIWLILSGGGGEEIPSRGEIKGVGPSTTLGLARKQPDISVKGDTARLATAGSRNAV